MFTTGRQYAIYRNRLKLRLSAGLLIFATLKGGAPASVFLPVGTQAFTLDDVVTLLLNLS